MRQRQPVDAAPVDTVFGGKYYCVVMKEITDKMVEKALRNLKLLRRFKPLFVVIGLIMLVLAGLFGHLLYQYIQEPWSNQSTTQIAFTVSMLTLKVGFNLLMGVFMICMGMVRNHKDILLEYLAEENLKKKQKQ